MDVYLILKIIGIALLCAFGALPFFVTITGPRNVGLSPDGKMRFSSLIPMSTHHQELNFNGNINALMLLARRGDISIYIKPENETRYKFSGIVVETSSDPKEILELLKPHFPPGRFFINSPRYVSYRIV